MLPRLLLAALAASAAALGPGAADAICDATVKQYSGFVDLATGDKHLFYWAFESRGDPTTDPVILWMTGGPGCSSEVALFGENGPCKVNDDGTDTTPNPYSWNNNATLIYVDQPTGTGFSYGENKDHDEAGVARDMTDFLVQWFATYPQFANNDFFVTGESYAGHYVPAVAHGVFTNGTLKNLKGLAIGNGLTDPEIQYAYYKDQIVSTNDHDPAVPPDGFVHKAMVKATPPCIKGIQACNSNASLPGTCLPVLEGCELALEIPYTLTGMNPYDMRLKCEVPPLCYDFSNVATYLDRDDVRAALGVGDRRWVDCSKTVAIRFELSGDYMKDYQQMLPEMLEAGIRMLIYAGDQDYICNWLGNQAWTLALPWSGQEAFNATAVADWSVAGEKAGELRKSGPFAFLRVLDAGHMVPMDQPEAALAMINSFIADDLA
mmetsp:Transcript_23277/g.69716  ORF Transcript_23277/g.69716 Transcript_23277/m.69716 type:complete len:434 (+) Transcript_23277:141-1442(+)